MATSEIGVCNIALGHIGSAPINAFGDNNIRSRVCNAVYPEQVKLTLAEHDWTFARRYQNINLVTHVPATMPLGFDGYQLPTTCLNPRDIVPVGTCDRWEVSGRLLMVPSDVYGGIATLGLYFTGSDVSVGNFSPPYTELLALGIAAKIAYPITQDKVLARDLRNEYSRYRLEAWEINANTGNTYRPEDERHENDTFVNPPE